MNNTQKVFSAITTHLVSLTGTDEYGHSKSRNIKTYSDLAEELNNEGLHTTTGTLWTTNSLKCFLSRCRKNYSLEELKDCCPLELIGAGQHEHLANELMPMKRPRPIRFKRQLYNNISVQ